MRGWLLALLLTAAGVPLASASDAVASIDACIRQLDPGLDVGYARVAERCPDLAPSLAHSPWAPWLPSDWNRPGNQLSASGLTELRTLLARKPRTSSAPAPRIARVAPVLAALELNERTDGSWWARFKEWLHELAERLAQQQDRGWLRRLLGSIDLSQHALEGIAWVALAVVVALAATIVANELRVAGLLGRTQRTRRARAAGTAETRCALTLDEVERVSPAQQPRLLLELIVARLGEQRRLPPAQALTVHELERAAELPDDADRGRLAALVAVCERVRYAGSEVPAPMLAAALAHARELLGSLAAPPRQGAGAA